MVRLDKHSNNLSLWHGKVGPARAARALGYHPESPAERLREAARMAAGEVADEDFGISADPARVGHVFVSHDLAIDHRGPRCPAREDAAAPHRYWHPRRLASISGRGEIRPPRCAIRRARARGLRSASYA